MISELCFSVVVADPYWRRTALNLIFGLRDNPFNFRGRRGVGVGGGIIFFLLSQNILLHDADKRKTFRDITILYNTIHHKTTQYSKRENGHERVVESYWNIVNSSYRHLFIPLGFLSPLEYDFFLWFCYVQLTLHF